MQVVKGQPLTYSRRRQLLFAFLQAKMASGDPELMAEGCQGLWELSVNREDHVDATPACMAGLLEMLSCESIEASGQSGGTSVKSSHRTYVWPLPI